MTNISKRKIDKKDYSHIYNELITLVTKLNHKTAPHFLGELLTESEQIMIVKRFGAAFMFSQAYKPYRVAITLGMSAPTAYRLYGQYDAGEFNKLLSCVNKKEHSHFLSLLEDLIVAQASPRARARLMARVM